MVRIIWKIASSIGWFVSWLFGIFLYLTAISIHLYTVIIALEISGFGAALLTFIFPLLSTVFWFIMIWIKVGSFWNFYNVGIVTYLIIVGIFYSIVFLVGYIEEKRSPEVEIDLGYFD